MPTVGDVSTWWAYVLRVAQTEVQVRISERSGIDQPTLSRWKTGAGVTPDKVATFARGMGRPVLEAFVAAGFLTADEAGRPPSAAPSLDSLDNDDLIDELRARLRRSQGGDHERDAAPMSRAWGSQAVLHAIERAQANPPDWSKYSPDDMRKISEFAEHLRRRRRGDDDAPDDGIYVDVAAQTRQGTLREDDGEGSEV